MQIMNAADELLWFLGIKLFDILYISMRLVIYEIERKIIVTIF